MNRLLLKQTILPPGFASPRAFSAFVACAGAACFMVTGTMLALFRPEIPAKIANRTLTFAERVAYQRAIEEVYWRHRIWPKENLRPKPSLDELMSAQQIEKKVKDYLRDSQALETYSQRPITSEQLQAEMERMAQNTKQPEVLRELFEALGNDPFVIAECLARPVLTERLIADVSTQHETGRFGSAQSNGLRSMSMAARLANVAYTLPRIAEGDPPCTDDTWTATSTTNAPTARAYHTAVWTGTEMIVWGGYNGIIGYLNTGGRYNPSTDSWTATSTTNAPTARAYHTAVWTGTEMIVWGGYNDTIGYLNTGGSYNPSTDSWTATSTTNAPSGRVYHAAVWTGSEMIVWGGSSPDVGQDNTGGKYNPNTNSWTATDTMGAPTGRVLHTAVWSGSEMIVWGGHNDFIGDLNTGGRYNPSTNSWTATSTTNAPTARAYHTAVWTGSEMIVWGGFNNDLVIFLDDGGTYNPSTNSWTATSTTNAPTARAYHTAVWTGSEMIVWGGLGIGGPWNTGGKYYPVTDSWTATSTINAPTNRYNHTSVWIGTEMIVWGGFNGKNYSNTGGRYCAQPRPPPTPTPTPTTTVTPTPTPPTTPTPCTGRCAPTPRPRPTPHPRP